MKKIVRAVSLMLLLTGFSGNAVADENGVLPRNGAIQGRVVDNENQTLPGATIYIEDLKTGVVSDINGFYTLPNLKPGTYTVRVTYVGYETMVMKMTVGDGKTTEKDIVMSEGLELQEVVVKGAFSGQRKAINMQKNGMGVTNVVSADQVGKFPDSNIGDALKRINGINVQYDMGEARFGQVRGTSADLTSVTVNGNRIPSAEEDWVMVVGHHPIYAETPKDESERLDMQNTLGKVLGKYPKVAMYLCGHIHNFQHIRVPGSPIDYVVNSSASLSRKVKPIEGTQFCSPETGFSVIAADKKELCLHMIDKTGKVLYTVRRQK